MSEKKQTTKKPQRQDERWNLRNLPTRVVGIPEELYKEYTIEISIMGPSSVVARLREINDDGSPGKFIPYSELQKLAKSPGFVKAQTKTETKDELTRTALALFFNAKLDPKTVKDPKGFTKLIVEYQKNINKTEESLQRAGDSSEDVAAAGMLHELIKRAKRSVNALISDRIHGGTTSEDELLRNYGFPKSMKSKILTGSFEVAAQGKFWTSLYGKEMNKFCNLTLAEIRDFSKDHLELFYPDEFITHVKKNASDKKLAEMCGFKDWKEVPDKLKERVLSFTLPIELRVREVEMIRRQAATKTNVSLKNIEASEFPILDKVYNDFLRKHYVAAPRILTEVKAFWERVSGESLTDPSIVSKDYRLQAIEALDQAIAVPRDPKEVKRGCVTKDEALIINGIPLEMAILISASYLDPKGNRVVVGGAAEDFRKYQPIEIVGLQKAEKKKDRERDLQVKRNDLSERSEQLFEALVERGISKSVLKDVKQFLQSFLYIKMQEMAAHIVYTTCEVSEQTARQIILGEDPPDEIPEEPEEPVEEDEKGKGKKKPPLPPVLAPVKPPADK